jgi:hypothetical protein
MIADYRLIKEFTTKVSKNIFLKSRDVLSKAIDDSKEPVVVITHHLPSWQSVSPKYKGHPTNAAFASHLDHLVIKTKVWMHGHTHSTQNYMIKDARVVCNPRGYMRSTGPENPEFDDNFVMEI